MESERAQRQIDRLLDEAEEAITRLDSQVVRARAQAVLRLDPGNNDACAYLSAADRDMAGVETSTPAEPICRSSVPAVPEHPTSFANGRYQVKEFLGESGKKRVYQAHDSILDRDVALAVIKTEGQYIMS